MTSMSTDDTPASDAAAAASASSYKVADVVDLTVHPLVLLSAADHYHRVARGTRKRVVGILLGSVSGGRVDASNSFAVPFEEDSRNPAVFYLDHNFLENMLLMFKKVNAKERVVGFYSTGPSIRPNDLRIHEIVKRFLPATTSTPPIFCIIDVRPDRPSLPTTAYKVVEEVSTRDGQRQVRLSFAHVPSLMGAMEPEEVGVEHLLRDINDPTISTVASLIKGKVAGLDTLAEKLKECQEYLEFAAAASSASENTTAAVSASSQQRKVNPEIVANLQTILNLLPNLNTDELVRSMLIKTNDMHMAIYLSALIRCVLALHDLINNKIQYGDNGLENNNADEATSVSPTPAAATLEEEKKEDSNGAAAAADGKKGEKKDKL